MNLSTMLVGVNFRPKPTKTVVEHLLSGEVLRLERDADNPYDINAIKVMKDYEEADSDFLGFVSRHDAAAIAPIMDGGAVVTCKVIHNNGIKEVHLEVEYPDDAIAAPTVDIPNHTAPKSLGDLDDEVPF